MRFPHKLVVASGQSNSFIALAADAGLDALMGYVALAPPAALLQLGGGGFGVLGERRQFTFSRYWQAFAGLGERFADGDFKR